MKMRDAVAEDAPAACQILRRSIVELCVADHRNDPDVMAKWLNNKTPENVRSWLLQPGNSLLVAVEDDAILAVGNVTDAGLITLNYVSPDARFRGVSRALIGALEARAAERGCVRCRLISTETARRFYTANGYIEDGPPITTSANISGYPLSKAVATWNPEKIVVREALEADLDTLVRLNRVVQQVHARLEPMLFKAVTNDAEVSGFFAARLAAPENTICLAQWDGRPVGYIWFEKQDQPETCLTLSTTRLYVHHLAVEEPAQRLGVASTLLRQAEVTARALGIQRIVVGTWAANWVARTVFEARGFSALSLTLGKSAD